MKPTRRRQGRANSQQIICRLPAVVTDPHEGLKVEAASCRAVTRTVLRRAHRAPARSSAGLPLVVTPDLRPISIAPSQTQPADAAATSCLMVKSLMVKSGVLKHGIEPNRSAVGAYIKSRPRSSSANIAVRLAWPEPWSKASHQAARRAELAAMTMKPSNFNCAHN